MNSEIICTCFNLTQADILAAIKEKNLQTVEEIGDATFAGTVCGACIDKLREMYIPFQQAFFECPYF